MQVAYWTLVSAPEVAMATTSRSSELELASSSPLPAHLLAALELVFLPVQESETSQLTYSTTFEALLARHASQHVKEQHLHIDVPPTGCFSTMPPSPLLTPSPHLTSPSAPEELCMASLTAHHVTLGPGEVPVVRTCSRSEQALSASTVIGV
jgi:hypothetical protein